jgi:hypothetical protein
MSAESDSQLNLTWTESESRRCPSLHFEAPGEGDGALTRSAALEVCLDPRCDCYAVHFWCEPVLAGDVPAQPERSYEFWLDVWDRSVARTPELEADAGALRLAENVHSRLSDSAWDELYRWFRAAKPEIIQTMEVAEIEIGDLPNADGGQMVGFVDVFPRGLALDFPFENQLWAADEQYCVQPKCNCKEAVLLFLRYADSAGREFTRLSRPPALRYNYRSGAISRASAGAPETPAPEQLLTALKGAHASLDAQLELRHLIMQSLYARHYMARITSKLESLGGAPTRGVAKKPGRNDSCPCGSGKKYKKCCGA